MLNVPVANEYWSDVLLNFPATAVTVMSKTRPGCKLVKWTVVIVVVLLYENCRFPFEMFTM